jgi:hypothetical protein
MLYHMSGLSILSKTGGERNEAGKFRLWAPRSCRVNGAKSCRIILGVS